MAFIVYDLTLQMLRELKPLIEQVRRHSPSLADQMERAGQGTFLNLSREPQFPGQKRGRQAAAGADRMPGGQGGAAALSGLRLSGRGSQLRR